MIVVGETHVFWRIALLLASVCLLSGCREPAPTLHPFTGVVIYRGKPLPEAELTFHPQFEGPGWMPVATTGPDGAFAAGTRLPGDGALPGPYKVTAAWYPEATDSDSGPNRLPARYADAKTTPLEAVVGPDASPPARLLIEE